MVQAKDLLAVDSSVFSKTKTSDPLVTFTVHGDSAKSTVKKKTLAPNWMEHFIIPADDEGAVLEVVVDDYDTVGANDFMGRVEIPLANLTDKLRHKVSGVTLAQGLGNLDKMGVWRLV